jgi:hypothetical protein
VGVRALPPDLLDTLAPWCWDWGETTGDARFCSLSRSLQILADTFDKRGESGGPPAPFVDQVDDLLRADVPSVLDATSAEEGSLLARALRQELARIYGEYDPALV